MSTPALVLCISGHDPSGGAGLQADIETVKALGGHALGVITALTVQDSRNVSRVAAVAPSLLAEQLQALLDDCKIAAIKIGLLGEAAQLPVIVQAIRRAQVPVVFDPVLRAGGGTDLVGTALQTAVIEQLLPQVTLLTPNAAEARRLAPAAADLDTCAAALLTAGCANLLVTGGDEAGDGVTNTWYRRGARRHYEWPRLPETFHGAGCTLASAIATLLAQGRDLAEAIEQGQRWTQQTLQQALTIGHGRRIPGRGR